MIDLIICVVAYFAYMAIGSLLFSVIEFLAEREYNAEYEFDWTDGFGEEPDTLTLLLWPVVIPTQLWYWYKEQL